MKSKVARIGFRPSMKTCAGFCVCVSADQFSCDLSHRRWAGRLNSEKTFIEERADPGRFIVAHSDGHGLPTNQAVAALGAWVSFDGIGRRPLESHRKLVRALTEKYAGHLLLSQDSGWYWVGQKNGGEVRNFKYLSDVFLPALHRSGISEATIRKLTVEKQANAFAIRFHR